MAQVTFTNEQTAKVAGLIKIRIPEDELPKYSQQLTTVLDAVGVLQEVDTTDLPITAQTHGLTNVLREDVAMKGLDMSDYKNRKNFDGKNFVIKNKVL
jgi:aspartyl-tRNA(Asn)/glutamyl-tRNA(Gln) amidotransferase subunit C